MSQTMARIKRAVQQVERAPVIDHGPGTSANSPMEWWAYTPSGGIPAGANVNAVDGSGTTLLDSLGQPVPSRTSGHATCTLYYMSSTGRLEPYFIEPAPPATTAHPGSAEIYNWTGQLIKEKQFIQVEVKSGLFFAKSVESGDQIYRAKVTTAIPTGTLASPGLGAAKLWTRVGSTWTESASAVTVSNAHAMSSSIAVGKTIHVGLTQGGYSLLTSDC